MDDDFIIDDMTTDDLDEVFEIEKVSFSDPWSIDLFKKELQNPHSFNLVVRGKSRSDRSVAAYIVYWIAADEMQILDLAVDERLRRHGMGRVLIRSALKRAAVDGARHAFLEVRRGNKAGISLYKALGFAEIGERRKYYKDGEDAIVMGLRF
ncbi:MAG: ribosomal protein S18-alanine N-acetyltransferase [bacterium]|nr:ribosomal protein S18-alanine N-acetyltransferase [bacterium]